MAMIQDLVLCYDDPVIRALVQLVPTIGGSIDTVLAGAVERIAANRTRIYFDELARGAVKLDLATAQSEPFLHAFFCTTRAAQATRQQGKIQLFARLLASGTRGILEYGDDYEDLLSILEDTSYSELLTLSRLGQLEYERPYVWFQTNERETDEERAARIWPEFLKGFGNWSYERIRAHMVRLERTGLYEPFVGGSVGPDGHQGRTTDSYRRLASATSSENETIVNTEPLLGDFELVDVRFHHDNPWSPDGTIRSYVAARVVYRGKHSIEARAIRLAIEYPDKDHVQADITHLVPLTSGENAEFQGEYIERFHGIDTRCQLRISGIL